MAKRKYPTDTEAGIRPINVIRSLPSCELTDEEFTKEFFERFEARALILTYVDKDGQYFSFGRLNRAADHRWHYRKLLEKLHLLFHKANIQEI